MLFPILGAFLHNHVLLYMCFFDEPFDMNLQPFTFFSWVTMYHMVLIVERIICYMFGLSLASRINKVWIINVAKNPTRPLNEWSEVGYVFMSHILIPVSIIVSLILTLVIILGGSLVFGLLHNYDFLHGEVAYCSLLQLVQGLKGLLW